MTKRTSICASLSIAAVFLVLVLTGCGEVAPGPLSGKYAETTDGSYFVFSDGNKVTYSEHIAIFSVKLKGTYELDDNNLYVELKVLSVISIERNYTISDDLTEFTDNDGDDTYVKQ